jgi:hypothetical protein
MFMQAQFQLPIMNELAETKATCHQDHCASPLEFIVRMRRNNRITNQLKITVAQHNFLDLEPAVRCHKNNAQAQSR